MKNKVKFEKKGGVNWLLVLAGFILFILVVVGIGTCASVVFAPM